MYAPDDVAWDVRRVRMVDALSKAHIQGCGIFSNARFPLGCDAVCQALVAWLMKTLWQGLETGPTLTYWTCSKPSGEGSNGHCPS